MSSLPGRPARRLATAALLVGALLCASTTAPASGLFHRELDLPARGVSQRVTHRPAIKPGETFVLFDEEGPGCLLHWWLTLGERRDKPAGERERVHDLQLRAYYDGESRPAIDLTLAQFFAVMLERDGYKVDSEALKVLPQNAYNCYLPMPFRKLRLELQNTGSTSFTIWFMGDWQQYRTDFSLTPLRLNTVFRKEAPAEPFGSFLMADFAGEGFLASMVKAVRILDRSDSWYHTGGDLVLIDGETAPRALRGIGGEDVFNMSFGIWPVQTEWVGSPYTERQAADNALGSGYEGVMYRVFGPDPIWFNSSAVVRFGSKANHLESVVYAYVAPVASSAVITPGEWRLAGPFACDSFEDFERREWADAPIAEWPREHVADFGVYLANLATLPTGPTAFAVPLSAKPEHGWCDFSRYYRGRRRTNTGAQPVNCSAYAVGEVDMPAAGEYTMHLGYDDWMTVWVGERQIYTGRHEQGFRTAGTRVVLPAGRSVVRVKLSNFDNRQWRLWAFNLRFTPVAAR